MKTLFPKSALSRRVVSFSSLPYCLIISAENKEIRKNYRCINNWFVCGQPKDVYEFPLKPEKEEMKSFLFFLMTIIMLFSMFLASCKKETESEPKITIISKGPVWGLIIAVSGTITIDWGDGTKTETHTLHPINWNLTSNDWPLPEDKHVYQHDYRVITEFTITITGKSFMYFSCSGNPTITNLDISSNETLLYMDCFGCQLTSLDVSNATVLATLRCSYNQLTSLDMSSNCGALYNLQCENNNLTTEALNALFETLHENWVTRAPKKIYIGNNPGTDFCDRSIATKKRWDFID